MDRISILCSYLEPCKTFADVACDHGYCAEYMLKNNLCESAVIADISSKSLEKAKTLLSGYISSGRCRAVCCDGLKGIDGSVGCVMIAGIGGDEIIKILSDGFIPQSFVFQPMKNHSALRKFLVGRGCKLTADDVFTDGKNYYFLIKGVRDGNNESYTEAALKYGKDSLGNPVFRQYLQTEIDKKKGYLQREMSRESRCIIEDEIKYMQGVLSGENC